jgi:TPP-dependent pyruvate/acetoin dehydrogenase alpha subunit
MEITANSLINFETRIAKAFNEARIRAPIHLYSNNEHELINIFKSVKPDDWVFCSWRSHYQCLLKGVPENEVEAEIIKGKSISLCFPKYKIYSSAIVGGVLPIAVGAAMSIKKKKASETVHCFLGEMTSETGIAHESIKYSIAHDLPIRFIIEDNGKSVMTDTREVWSLPKLSYEEYQSEKIIYYKYDLKFPHAGAGVRVQF